MATRRWSGTKPGYVPAASTSPVQGTPLRPGPWPPGAVGPGYTAGMAGRSVAAVQSKPPSCNCRADDASGLADRRSSMSISRRPSLPGARMRWDT
jgi:hypothetical protein